MYSASHTDIIPLVKSMVEAFRLLAQSKQLTLLFKAPGQTSMVHHQPEALANSLLNMLCRIMDHLPGGTGIEVAVIENNKSVVIRIENTGLNLSRVSQITTGCILPVRIEGNERNKTVYYFDIAKTTTADIEPVKEIAVNNRPYTNIPAFYAEIRKRLQSHSDTSEKMVLLTKVHSPADAAFLQKINELIVANIADELFDANHLAEKMFLSRAQVFRKLKLITGKAPAGYIKLLRLQQAKKLLETTDVRVSEVAFATGFESVSHFTKVFSHRYGFTPSFLKKSCCNK